METIGVIPARWGSTRFPGKSLAMLGGKPVIRWVYERAGQARRLASLAVATDDERIRTAVEAFGGRVVMTKNTHPSGTDRVAEAIGGMKEGVAVNIQGDEPFVDPALIDSLVGAMEADESWDMATAAVPIRDRTELNDPSVVKVVWDAENRALFFSRSVIPFDRDHGYDTCDALYWRHLGIYAYRIGFLRRLVSTPPCRTENVEKLEQLRALHIGARIKVLEAASAGIGIDTPGDLARAGEMLMSAAGGRVKR